MKCTTGRMVVRYTGVVLALPLLTLASLSQTPAQDGASSRSNGVKQPASAASPAVGYTGVTKCAACHFSHYKDWKSTPHGKAYDILPAKYRNDTECLTCHTTPGRGTEPSPSLAETGRLGVSCESCHGPGGEHARYALSFVNRDRVFNDQELKTLRSKIKRLALDQCIRCHTSKAHKPHPKFDREPSVKNARNEPRRSGGRSFFDVHKQTSARRVAEE